MALTGCKDDKTTSNLVENPILPPATEIFAPGSSITVKGSGFTAADEIWFRVPTKATEDVSTPVTKQTPTEITFSIPFGLAAGEQTILLKRDKFEMILGKITIKESPAARLYISGDGISEVDRATGELTEINAEADFYDVLVTIPGTNAIYGTTVADFVPDDDDQSSASIVHKSAARSKITTKGYNKYKFASLDLTSKKYTELADLPESEDTYWKLCVIDNKLHALQVTYSTGHISLYSVDPATGVTTLVTDFGSVATVLNLPTGSFELALEGDMIYDPGSKRFIGVGYVYTNTSESGQCFALDMTSKKIVAGQIGDEDVREGLVFQMGNQIGVAIVSVMNYDTPQESHKSTFYTLDPVTVTLKESIGEFDDYTYNWTYDAATNTAYSSANHDGTGDNQLSGTWIHSYDFTAKQSKLMKQTEKFFEPMILVQ